MAPHTSQDPSPHHDVQTWFVAFTSYRGRNPLYRFFLSKGFGHVFLFSKIGADILLVDPQEGGIGFKKLSPPDGLVYDDQLSVFTASLLDTLPDLTLLQVRVNEPGHPPKQTKHPAMFWPSCVTVVKAILCRQSWALTPRGLHRKLLKDGAKVVGKPATENCPLQKIQHNQTTIKP